MKKIIFLVMAMILILAFSGCGRKDPMPSTTPETRPSTIPATRPESETMPEYTNIPDPSVDTSMPPMKDNFTTEATGESGFTEETKRHIAG